MPDSNVIKANGGSLVWSFEAAYHSLLPKNSSESTIKCLDSFLSVNLDRLTNCFDPVPAKSDASKKILDSKSVTINGKAVAIDDSIKDDAETLSELLDIDQIEAVRIVYLANLKEFAKSKKLVYFSRKYFSECRFAIKLATLLFTIDPQEGFVNDLVNKYRIEILSEKTFLLDLFTAITKTLSLEPIRRQDNEGISTLESNEVTLRCIDLLQLTLSIIRHIPPTKKDLGNWVNVLEKTQLLELRDSGKISSTLYALSTLITLAFIDLEQDFEAFLDTSYINDVECVSSATQFFVSRSNGSPSTSPVTLAWSFVTHRLSNRLASSPDSSFDSFVNSQIIGSDLNDFSAKLAKKSLDQNAFNYILQGFNSLPQNIEFAAGYSSLLKASLSYVSVTVTVAKTISTILTPFPGLSALFFADPIAERALHLARAKFPIAIEPFLYMCRAAGTSCINLLQKMDTYMQELPRGFKHFKLSSEDPSIMELNADLCLYSPRRSDNKGGIIILPGARGQILPGTDSPVIVMWAHQYNGWGQLGRILENSALTSTFDPIIVTIIDFITYLLESLDDNTGFEFLKSCSAYLGDGDIIDIVIKLLDEALYSRKMDLVVVCVKFLTALTSSCPTRVWPYIGRSGLLGQKGHGGMVANILGSTETVTNDYRFTISIIELVNALVSDAISSSIDKSVSQKIKDSVLRGFIKHFIEVFESFSYWKYNDNSQCVTIAQSLLALFNRILTVSYAVDGHSEVSDKVVSVFDSSVKILVSTFLKSQGNDLRTLQPILNGIKSSSGSLLPLDSNDYLKTNEFNWVLTVLRFVSNIVRIRSMINAPPSLLESQLYAKSEELAYLYTRYSALHAPITEVFDSIISGQWPNEQPSLLAHLGQSGSQIFLSHLASSMENNLESASSQLNICIFFGSVVNGKQEGLSILLLSGMDTQTKKSRTVSLLNTLEEKVLDLDENALVTKLSVMLVDAVSLAHNSWTTIVGSRDNDRLKKLIMKLISLVKRLSDSDDEEAKTSLQIIHNSYKNLIVARSIEIIALEVYKEGKSDVYRDVVSQLIESNDFTKMSEKFLAIKGYNDSLHGSLFGDFQKRWPAINLAKFVRSKLVHKTYGESYAYNLNLLDDVLMDDASWASFRQEVVEANLNLSYIDSQKAVVKSWSSLITSLAAVGTEDSKILTALEPVSRVCLTINAENGTVAPILEEIYDIRLQISFLIIHKLFKSSPKLLVIGEYQSTLYHAWSLLESSDVEFLFSISSSGKTYYKSLLKIIILLLDLIANDSGNKKTVKFSLLQIVSSILETVVANGSRALIESIHGSNEEDKVEDMVHIISILRKCLSVPESHTLFDNFSKQIAESGCLNLVLSLFSYSEKLLINGDCVYGELSLLLLLELSTIESIAEQLVVGGIFGSLSDSPIAKSIQDGNIEPTTRLHNIYTKGMLPIVLILLRQLSGRVIPEVLTFMNFYSAQIKSCFKSWLDPNIITLSSISELYETVILFQIVLNQDEVGSHIGFVDSLAFDKEELSEAIDYLLAHPRYLASKLIATTVEEQTLLDQKVKDSTAEEVTLLYRRVVDELTEIKTMVVSEAREN